MGQPLRICNCKILILQDMSGIFSFQGIVDDRRGRFWGSRNKRNRVQIEVHSKLTTSYVFKAKCRLTKGRLSAGPRAFFVPAIEQKTVSLLSL